MENNEKLVLKILCVIIWMTWLKFQDTYFDILLDGKSYETILTFGASYKTLAQNIGVLSLIK